MAYEAVKQEAAKQNATVEYVTAGKRGHARLYIKWNGLKRYLTCSSSPGSLTNHVNQMRQHTRRVLRELAALSKSA